MAWVKVHDDGRKVTVTLPGRKSFEIEPVPYALLLDPQGEQGQVRSEDECEFMGLLAEYSYYRDDEGVDHHQVHFSTLDNGVELLSLQLVVTNGVITSCGGFIGDQHYDFF